MSSSTKIFSTILLLLVVVLGLHMYRLYHSSTNTTSEETANTSVPKGTPGPSAPREAVDACEDKKESETCSFALHATTLHGVCQIAGDSKACTPVIPKE